MQSDLTTLEKTQHAAPETLKLDQTIIDGILCEAINGSWYSVEDGDEIAPIIEEGFSVKDESSANWVLSKMLDAESQLAAIKSSPEVLRAKAILANAASLENKAKQKLDWLDKRFKAEMAEYARVQLDGKKTRTWKTILGSVAFRTVPGAVKVANEELAIRYAEDQLSLIKECVKVQKTFLISNLPKDAKEHVSRIHELLGDSEKFVSENNIDSLDQVHLFFGSEPLGSLFIAVDGFVSWSSQDPIDYEDFSVEALLNTARDILAMFVWEPASEKVTIKTGVER